MSECQVMYVVQGPAGEILEEFHCHLIFDFDFLRKPNNISFGNTYRAFILQYIFFLELFKDSLESFKNCSRFSHTKRDRNKRLSAMNSNPVEIGNVSLIIPKLTRRNFEYHWNKFS